MLGFSLDAISKILGVNKSIIKARLHRAKLSMKEYFSGRCQWAPKNGDCSCESKLGFALSAAPDIIQKLRNLPPDQKMKRLISTTLGDVTNFREIRNFFPDEDINAELVEKLLSSI
jgi:hypothetical protein